MKLLHLLPTLEARGAQIFARDLMEELDRRGTLQQSLVVLQKGTDAIGATTGLVPVTTLPAARGVDCVRRLRRVLRQQEPDIVFAHGGQPLKFAVLARGSRRLPRIVYRKIGLTEQWLGRPRWLRLCFQRWLLARADAVAAVGESMRGELSDLFRLPRERTRVIYQGVAPERFEVDAAAQLLCRQELVIDPAAPVLISVGALSWEKNQAAMLRCLGPVIDEHPKLLLLLVGDGPERGRLQALVDELGLGNHVRLLGVRKDVPRLLAAADALLLTSLTEGVPGVLIEAGMAGIPTVAWQVAGVNEVIEDGHTGRVTPYRDEECFAQALLDLLSDPTRGEEMGAAARERCRQRFALSRCADEHVEMFSAVREGCYDFR